MDTTDNASREIIQRLLKEYTHIIQSYVEDLLGELDSWSLIPQEEHFQLNEIEDPKEKVTELLRFILLEEKPACQQLLDSLENLQYAFPELWQIFKTLGTNIKTENEDVRKMLKMNCYKTNKLSSCDILKVCAQSVREFKMEKSEDIPRSFMRKLMSLNITARGTELLQSTEGEAVNPLDILCVLFDCSDGFLHQEIMHKMSMCQFALPLLLPPSDDSKYKFMLWAMRDMVRQWKPEKLGVGSGFREESLVLIPMPTISFVRLGSCSMSKSKLLNDLLSPPQQHHDFFIHRDMESGNVPRRISNGLVEISWYFPGGRKSSDVFPEPVAVCNLRGDIETNWTQFSFITMVSSAVFIFTNSLNEADFKLLSSLDDLLTKMYFVLAEVESDDKTMEYIKLLTMVQKSCPRVNNNTKKGEKFIMTQNRGHQCRAQIKQKTMNDSKFVKMLQATITEIMKMAPYEISLENMANTARNLGIYVDEDCQECQMARICAKEITSQITNVIQYKRDSLKLQGGLWKEFTRVEKEMYRMKRQAETPVETYKSKLKNDLIKIRTQQNDCDLQKGIAKFIYGIDQKSKIKKQYFLKWMKLGLDQIARSNLCNLREKYKEELRSERKDHNILKALDQKISESSLGLEHFMRELGQLYEAETVMLSRGKLTKSLCHFRNLPGIAVDLLLNGFPLELIDGDVSNIPLKWITDILTELHNKLRSKSKMLIITVLGVQSTGKSTLLNTMFGLQFSVSSGRCTRGAFMQLIKVEERLGKELNCDFILVIDTEGLKAPELATLEDSYEHDNELATLVIGLSDITIVNMSMENATEMKDILQIVVHAFLRMKKIGKKINCQFVHQNVSDVSASDKNMRDRQNLLAQLNEMTQAACKMEKQSENKTFSDIIEYDTEKHNWYIPNLWHGVPPMAPVNLGYSENVHGLKRYLFEFMKTRTPQDIPTFLVWLKSLWNSVKHEHFIFSFRNSLVAEAYHHLSVKYGEWDWAFRKEIHNLVTSAVTKIQNQASDKLEHFHETLKNEVKEKIYQKEQNILIDLEDYFKSGVKNAKLVQKYKDDFILSTKSVKMGLENSCIRKLDDAITIQKGKNMTQNILDTCTRRIEGHVERLLEACKKNPTLTEAELKNEFETMWTKAIVDLPKSPLKEQHVHDDMGWQLVDDLRDRGPTYQLVQEAQFFKKDMVQDQPSTTQKSWMQYLNPLNYIRKKTKKHKQKEAFEILNDLSESLTSQCMKFVYDKVESRCDYDSTYCKELLHIVNEGLKQKEVDKLDISPQFEVDLKRRILGNAECIFQKMHEDFVKENDPQHRVNKLKPQYFSTFTDIYEEKDTCLRRSEDFCFQCLKPSFVKYVNERLGSEVMENFTPIEYSSRTFLQFTILKELLEENSFQSFLEYICNYERFVKKWTWERILSHYQKKSYIGDLEAKLYAIIEDKVQAALDESESEQTIADFLEHFRRVLESDLLISKDNFALMSFQTKLKVSEFVKNVKSCLPELKNDILTEFQKIALEDRLTDLPFKILDELFRKVIGCGEQCPFCKVPCEAGALVHTEHFASVHRPEGLGQYRYLTTKVLVNAICSSLVCSDQTFQNSVTDWKPYPFKEYHIFYPNWSIQADPSLTASDYWKFVFKEFNEEFAKEYEAQPAQIPEDWKELSKEQALQSLGESFSLATKQK